MRFSANRWKSGRSGRVPARDEAGLQPWWQPVEHLWDGFAEFTLIFNLGDIFIFWEEATQPIQEGSYGPIR